MSTTDSGPYNWASDDTVGYPDYTTPRPRPARPAADEWSDTPDADETVPFGHSGNGTFRQAGPTRPAGPSRATRVAEAAGGFVGAATGGFVPPINVHVNGDGGSGGGRGGGRGPAAAPAGGSDRHQGDRLIYAIERIEIRSDRDILALAKAINHLGRELHLILGMRAEEINGVLSTYKGKWYTFGASSRVKARLVSAHLKVSAEAAKALGVGALKMAAAFDRHFVKPEQEAKRARKAAPKKTFTIGGE